MPRLIKKGESAVKIVNSAEIAQLDPEGWRTALLNRKSDKCLLPGDVVRVVKKDRTHFTGMLIAINRRGPSTNFILRNKVTGLGVESRYLLYSPNIESIELMRRPQKKKRRAKLYYVRGSSKHDVGDLETEIKARPRF